MAGNISNSNEKQARRLVFETGLKYCKQYFVLKLSSLVVAVWFVCMARFMGHFLTLDLSPGQAEAIK